MKLPTAQLDGMEAGIAALRGACPLDVDAAGGETDPATPGAASGQLTDVLRRAGADMDVGGGTGAVDITQLGDYGLQLATCLARQAGDDARPLAARLVIGLLWVADHGGIIDTLEPVVDALALFASSTGGPDELRRLYAVIKRIEAAVSPVIRDDLEKLNPGRPWRVLLNQGIVATRSHDTQLMEEAFEVLTKYLPEDDARFFSEGMQQMDAPDNPEHVREVMSDYHRRWNIDRSLH